MYMNSLPSSLRIGVLRGGPSLEYDLSLRGGARILQEFSETHRPIDIFISRDGKWHVQGVERSPERILKNVDVVFNALHGAYGEDGQVQQLLNRVGVPYTGSDRFQSAVSKNKSMAKDIARAAGIKTPISVVVRRSDSLSDKATEIWNSIPNPLVVKPVSGGSSLGVSVVESYSELLSSLEDVLAENDSALVEEYISGRQATCGVVDSFRGQDVYVLPVIEMIVPKDKKFFDFDLKYSDRNEEICPGNFSIAEKKEIERSSKLIHTKLGLRHYSRSDFIVSPRRGVYFIEVNALPGLAEKSSLFLSLKSVGVSAKEFLHHVVALALDGK